VSNDPSHDASNPKTLRFGCAIAILLSFGVVVLAIGSMWYVVHVAFTDFESHRDKMCLRRDLILKNENLRYSPGMDAVMWCRFTAQAKSIKDVFDSARVDTSEFKMVGYEFRQATPITDQWWDVDERNLIGGEVQVGEDFMRVAYVDNGDGTLTVYIFWFEV
jgi:hypothetical protein